MVEKRAKELKEAIPIPITLVTALEIFVMTMSELHPVRCLLGGWVLCLIYASLRFDDGLHGKRSAVKLLDNVLCGLCWQTKVDRKRRGTKFAIAALGFVDLEKIREVVPEARPRLLVHWDLLQQFCPHDRDFWMCDLNDQDTLIDRPMSYSRGISFVRDLLQFSLNTSGLPTEQEEVRLVLIPKITWHSCKVTLIDAAVQAGENVLAVSIQAHHSNTMLVEKYTRNRTHVPLQMIGRMAANFRENWSPPAPVRSSTGPAPAPLLDDDEFSEAKATEDRPLFFVKNISTGITTQRMLLQKFHVTACDSLGQLACSKFPVSECLPIGSELPDVEMICKKCRAIRSDIFAP